MDKNEKKKKKLQSNINRLKQRYAHDLVQTVHQLQETPLLLKHCYKAKLGGHNKIHL